VYLLELYVQVVIALVFVEDIALAAAKTLPIAVLAIGFISTEIIPGH
jgi:hypothetical protein